MVDVRLQSLLLSIVLTLGAGKILFSSSNIKLYTIHQKVESLRRYLDWNCPHLVAEEPTLKTRQLDKTIHEKIQIEVENNVYQELLKIYNLCQPQVPSQCLSSTTQNLTESWRNNHQNKDGIYSDREALDKGRRWFRFVGAAGRKLRDNCPMYYNCGSTGAFWSDDVMPKRAGETKSFQMYESWSHKEDPNLCRMHTYKATVTRCSANGDYVYRLDGEMSGGPDTVCGMD